MKKQLLTAMEEGLPSYVELTAVNISRTGTSVYSLLRQKRRSGPQKWLTLRLADHPLWLTDAQQVSIDFGNPADMVHLKEKISKLFETPEINEYYYQLSSLEVAVLQFLDECQKLGLVWAVRLPDEIFAAKKEIPLELEKEFIKAELFLIDRNNSNTLLLPVESKQFQAALAILFGRNLLFSQFSRGRILRLLPTNQWIQPIIEREGSSDWKERIEKEYGTHVIEAYEEGKDA